MLISVDERVPKAPCVVLGYGPSMNGGHGQFDVVGFDSVYGFAAGSEHITVTHWMALPTPPDSAGESQ